MKDQKVIRSPHAFQLLADETRLNMIYLLRAKELTVSQIAGELGLTPQTIYHHIKKLRKVDMVKISREERIDHLVESYYRATAGVFHFVHGSCDVESGSPKMIEKTLRALGSFGYHVDTSPAGIAKIVKLREKLRKRRKNPEIVNRVVEMDDTDPFTQEDVVEFAMMMGMSDKDFEKYLDTQRTLREWLLTHRKGEH